MTRERWQCPLPTTVCERTRGVPTHTTLHGKIGVICAIRQRTVSLRKSWEFSVVGSVPVLEMTRQLWQARDMTMYVRENTGHVFNAPCVILFMNKNAGLAKMRGLLQTVPYRIIVESEGM